MKPLSTFLRWHHPVILLFIVGMPVVWSLVSGWGAQATQFGWSLAALWVMAAIVELAALAADRWRADTLISRSSLAISLTALAIVLIVKLLSILTWVWILRWWYVRDPSAAYLAVLGTDFGLAGLAGVQMVVQWAGLLATFLLVRSHWARRGARFDGAIARILVAVIAFLWASSIAIAVDGSIWFLRRLGFDIMSMEWRVYYYGPTLFAVWTMLMALLLWLMRLWLAKASGAQAIAIMLAAFGVCLVPFVYGLLAFDSPLRQQETMGVWYVISIALLPVYAWMASVIILRTPRANGAPVR